ncbi:MAG: PQQ-dependent sugar dehydrogenase [Ignavibacteria bacterium]|nr:PQQ-dependent sugar dehydrogenase [Ignavibacteria bacterium]
MKKFYAIVLLSILSLPAFSQVDVVQAFPNRIFSAPVFLTHAGDASNRIFVVQQTGSIVVFPNDSSGSSKTTFLDISNKIIFGSEQGALGLAFHPAYSTNRFFYVNYTRLSDGATIVSRFQTQSGDPNKADSLSELVLLTIAQPFANHNGGMIMFGQDGYLYIGMGDGGSGGDPGNRAQNPNELLGKILRIDVNNPSGGNNYGIPSTNPYAGGGGRGEIYCIGMRNPWRFSQDPATGLIYAGDVGQGCWEEISLITLGGNCGWKIMEGMFCFVSVSGTQCNETNCNTTGLTLPIKQYSSHTGNECSVTGGYVYRGSRVPLLSGKYIYADYCSAKIWKLQYSGGVISDTAQIGNAPSPVYSFGVDQSNELYVLCANGRVYRFLSTVIGIDPQGNNIPDGYTLEQNYPNPFNPVTNFEFRIPDYGLVSLNIYDVIGREIAIIVNDEMTPGTYKAEWNASEYPSGVYFYKLIAGNVTLEKKMVLIK